MFFFAQMVSAVGKAVFCDDGQQQTHRSWAQTKYHEGSMEETAHMSSALSMTQEMRQLHDSCLLEIRMAVPALIRNVKMFSAFCTL